MIRKLIFAINILFSCLMLSAQVPSISSFVPKSGLVGATVTITGNNFSLTNSNNIVFFGNVKATVVSASATSLTVTVPAGAIFAPIKIINIANNLGTTSNDFFTPIFSPSKSTITATDYASSIDFTTNSSPNSVALADLDGDGKLDMVAANSASSNISVFRNTGSTGTISFAAKLDFTTSTSPLSVFAIDVDGDGLIDIVTANSTGNNISVLRNTSTLGTISFATKVDFATANGPGSVTGADFDNDGKIDLAVANRTSNSISVLRNTGTVGNISFASKQDFTTGSNPFSIATADIDGDNKFEIVVSNRNSASVSVFLNTSTTGTISFAARSDFATASDPVSVAIGDLDGDGLLDIIAQDWNPGKSSILRNTSVLGSLGFAAKYDFNMSGSGFSLVLGDFNGDGKVDATATHTTTNLIGVFQNNSVIGSLSFNFFPGSFATGANPQGMGAADIDGDGIPDFVVASFGLNLLRVYRSIPALPVGPPIINSFSPETAKPGTDIIITGANFNATGNANNTVYFGSVKATVTSVSSSSITVTVPPSAATSKITVTNNSSGLSGTSSTAFVTTFTPSGNRTFAARIPLTVSSTPYAVAVGDFDLDGLVDIVSANAATGVNTLSIFKNTSSIANISFGAKQDLAITGANNTQSIVVSDIDGDGKLDLVVASGSNFYSVLLNTSTVGNISFSAPTTFTTGTGFSVNYLAVADIDGDGKNDVVVSNSNVSTSKASVFRNTSSIGNISFAAKFDAASYTGAVRAIAVTDLNTDGKPDIIILNAVNISVVPNSSTTGNLSFGSKTDFASGSNFPLGLAVGDLNADGLPEISISSPSDISSIKIFLNTSTVSAISFGTVFSTSSIAGTNAITITDIDGDGKPDLAVASIPAGASGFMINNSTISGLSFASPKQASGTPLFGADAIAVADFDGDSKTDHVVNDNANSKLQVFRNISTNANLSSLTVSNGSLTPTFVSTTLSYKDSVLSATNSIQVTAALEDVVASFKVNGVATNNNTASASIPLNFGNNTITILVTAESGATKTYTIVVNRAANIPSINLGSSPQICQGVTSANLTYSNPISNPTTYSILWDAAAISAGLTNSTDLALPASPIVISVPSAIAGATYNGTITVKNSSTTGTPTAFTITVNSLPIVASITGLNSVCIGATTTLANTTAGGVWSSNNLNFATISSAGVVNGLAAGLPIITYAVTNSNGCVTSVTSTVTVNALPNVAAITGPNIVCQTKTIALSNATTGGVWSSLSANIASVGTTGLVTGILPGTSSVKYTVTDGNSCSAFSSSTITVNAQPARTSIAVDTLICKATNYDVNATIGSPATYAWTSIPAGFTSSSASVSLTNPALYRLLITLSNGCFYNDSINLRNTDNLAIQAKLLVTSQAYLNENVVAVNLTNPIPQSSIWQIPVGATIVSQTTEKLIMKFSKIGQYQIGLKANSYNVCNSSDSGKLVISAFDSTIVNTTQVLIREVNVAPNPSTGIFNFDIKLNRSGKVAINIYSISGVAVYSTIIPEANGEKNIKKQVDITSSPKNTYVAVIQTANGSEVRTLIKN